MYNVMYYVHCGKYLVWLQWLRSNCKANNYSWLAIFHVPYLIHVYIPGGYILIASIDSLILVVTRAPLAIVLHLLHKFLGKCLGDQRVPVDIRAWLKGREV